MAGWQSGYAAACKAVYSGSIPDSASIVFHTQLISMFITSLNLIIKYNWVKLCMGDKLIKPEWWNW